MTVLDAKFKWVVASGKGLKFVVWGLHESEDEARRHFAGCKPQVGEGVYLMQIQEVIPPRLGRRRGPKTQEASF